jgi:hypothetical protein
MKFVSYALSTLQGHPPRYYNAKKFVRGLGFPTTAGFYQGNVEQTYEVHRTVDEKYLAAVARKTKQDSIYARDAQGNTYLVDQRGGVTRFSNRTTFAFARLTSPMAQKLSKTAQGGSLRTRPRGGYEFEISAYPGAEKETRFATSNIQAYFRNLRHGTRVI